MVVVLATPTACLGVVKPLLRPLGGNSATPNCQKGWPKPPSKALGVAGGGQTTPRLAIGGGFGVAETTSLQSVSLAKGIMMEVLNWYLLVSRVLLVIQIET